MAFVLIGFMGAGKSTAARELAAALGVAARSTATRCSSERLRAPGRATSSSCSGEAAFRAREEELVCELLGRRRRPAT